MFSVTAALAEEGGEGEKKPPPKPFKGSPTAAVFELPIVKQWKKSLSTSKSHVQGWGESLNTVDGNECWSITVGELRPDGLHPWRRFCVPVGGGEILVESIVVDDAATVTYTPYAKWVTDCKPTATFQGNC